MSENTGTIGTTGTTATSAQLLHAAALQQLHRALSGNVWSPDVTWSFDRKGERALTRDLLDAHGPQARPDRKLALVFTPLTDPAPGTTLRIEDGRIVLELDPWAHPDLVAQAEAVALQDADRAVRRAELDAQIAALTAQRDQL